MAEPMSEKLTWWVVITAGAVGALIFMALLTVAVVGIFLGAPGQ